MNSESAHFIAARLLEDGEDVPLDRSEVVRLATARINADDAAKIGGFIQEALEKLIRVKQATGDEEIAPQAFVDEGFGYITLLDKLAFE